MGNPVTLATPAIPAAAPVAPITSKPFAYTNSTGNAFTAFVKFNRKDYFMWGRNIVTQLHALGVRIVDGGGSSRQYRYRARCLVRAESEIEIKVGCRRKRDKLPR